MICFESTIDIYTHKYIFIQNECKYLWQIRKACVLYRHIFTSRWRWMHNHHYMLISYKFDETHFTNHLIVCLKRFIKYINVLCGQLFLLEMYVSVITDGYPHNWNKHNQLVSMSWRHHGTSLSLRRYLPNLKTKHAQVHIASIILRRGTYTKGWICFRVTS